MGTKKYNILVVDDERPLAEMICMNFPKDQFSVKACFNGWDALEEIRQNRPDLVVLDVMMPDIDGWQILQKLKSDPSTSSIPVILCTAKDSLEDVEKSYQYGAQSYLIKPIVFNRLLKKVAAILDIEKLLSD